MNQRNRIFAEDVWSLEKGLTSTHQALIKLYRYTLSGASPLTGTSYQVGLLFQTS